jgi:hypothetical protein
MFMPATALPPSATRSAPAAFAGGAIIGALGGLIGLGGAEFRLPLLIGAFRFAALEAVILNKAMSLVVVASALPFRATAVPFGEVAAHWQIIVNLLAGSLLGAWFGAGWATRLKSKTLYRVIAIMLGLIAIVLVIGHGTVGTGAILTGVAQAVAGVIAGFGIGIVAAARRRWRRAADSDTRAAVRCRYQAGGQSVARGEPADDDRRIYPLQPGPQFRRARAKSILRGGDGGRVHCRQLHRRPSARAGSNTGAVAAAPAILVISAVKVWRHT